MSKISKTTANNLLDMNEFIHKTGYTIKRSYEEKYIGTNLVDRWRPRFCWVSELEYIFLWNNERGPEDFIKRVQKSIEFSREHTADNYVRYHANVMAQLDNSADELFNIEIVNIEITAIKDCGKDFSIKILHSTPSIFLKSTFGVK